MQFYPRLLMLIPQMLTIFSQFSIFGLKEFSKNIFKSCIVKLFLGNLKAYLRSLFNICPYEGF